MEEKLLSILEVYFRKGKMRKSFLKIFLMYYLGLKEL